MNGQMLDTLVPNILPNNSNWLAKCKQCKYYYSTYTSKKSYSRIARKTQIKSHDIFNCENPKGDIFNNANCFVKGKHKRNIRSRLSTATVDKMRTNMEADEMVKLKVKESIQVPDGLHTGEIVRVEYRTDPYEYTDSIIQLDDVKVELKYGCPTHLSETSKLGKLLSLFTKLEVDKEIDIDKILIGQKVSFQTNTEKTQKGDFARILGETIKVIKTE